MSTIQKPDKNGVSIVSYLGTPIGVIKRQVEKGYQCEVCNQTIVGLSGHMLREHGYLDAQIHSGLKVVYVPTKAGSTSYTTPDEELTGESKETFEAVRKLLAYYRGKQ